MFLVNGPGGCVSFPSTNRKGILITIIVFLFTFGATLVNIMNHKIKNIMWKMNHRIPHFKENMMCTVRMRENNARFLRSSLSIRVKIKVFFL